MPTVTISPVAQGQLFNDLGHPLAGGKIFTYAGGSFSTLKVAYTDYQGTVAASNPIVLDSDGRLPYALWLTQGQRYNIVITASDGTTVLQTFENIKGVEPSGGGGGGTVTSVDVSGGTTGLTTSGGPIIDDGTITLGGTLNIANGGTGETTANEAFNALAPDQTGNAGKFLITDGTDTSWSDPASLPQPISNMLPAAYYSKTGNSGGPCLFVPASVESYYAPEFVNITDYATQLQTNVFRFWPINFSRAMTFRWLSWRGNYQSSVSPAPNFRVAIFKQQSATNSMPGEKIIDVLGTTELGVGGSIYGGGVAELPDWTVEPGTLYWVAILLKPLAEQDGGTYPVNCWCITSPPVNVLVQPLTWISDVVGSNWPQDASRYNTLRMNGTMTSSLGNNPPALIYKYTTSDQEQIMPMFWLRTA